MTSQASLETRWTLFLVVPRANETAVLDTSADDQTLLILLRTPTSLVAIIPVTPMLCQPSGANTGAESVRGADQANDIPNSWSSFLVPVGAQAKWILDKLGLGNGCCLQQRG